MPITITNCKSLAPLCKDYEFTVADENQLVELVALLCLGHCDHVTNIIRTLDPDEETPDEKSIKCLISDLEKAEDDEKWRDKVHGWLFQMMSWIALSEQHKADRFLQHYPHSQPAMQGLDGIAITLTEEGNIDRIIITEDKCTTNPRGKITSQVWGEFDDTEVGNKNNAIFQQIQSLFAKDAQWHQIKNDVTKEKYRQYRIGITRKACHNSDKGRKALFDGYKDHVKGDDVDRRTGATIYISDLRVWMESLRKKVIDHLNIQLKKKCSTL